MKTSISSSSWLLQTWPGNSRPFITGITTSDPGSIVGEVRYSGDELYVWTGTDWAEIGNSDIILDTNSTLNNVVIWAEEKMAEERELDQLCEKFPALAKARKNFELIKTFVASEAEKE